MKRRMLLGHLQEHGCVPFREGGSHSIWSNPKTGRKEAIPRHNEISCFVSLFQSLEIFGDVQTQGGARRLALLGCPVLPL
jgi:predicted RNA binding protein YcfA (HicA-like mRNA interferase family)